MFALASFKLKPVKALADGSYLAGLKSPRRSDGAAVTAVMRGIENALAARVRLGETIQYEVYQSTRMEALTLYLLMSIFRQSATKGRISKNSL